VINNRIFLQAVSEDHIFQKYTKIEIAIHVYVATCLEAVLSNQTLVNSLFISCNSIKIFSLDKV